MRQCVCVGAEDSHVFVVLQYDCCTEHFGQNLLPVRNVGRPTVTLHEKLSLIGIGSVWGDTTLMCAEVCAHVCVCVCMTCSYLAEAWPHIAQPRRDSLVLQ